MSAIYRFFGSILQFLDKITGNYMIALALFALIIQILMLPLAIKQQKNSIKHASLAPKVAALRKKYAGRTDKATQQKLQQETMDLYQKEGFNPAGGCLPLLIQLPIIMLLYQVIIKPLSYVSGFSSDVINAIGEKLVSLGAYADTAAYTAAMKSSEIGVIGKIHEKAAELSSIEGFSIDAVPNFTVGPFNLSTTPKFAISDGGWHWDWLILIPIVTLVIMYLTQKITRKFMYQPPEAQDQQNAMSMKIMNLTMPLFSAYIAYIWPAAIGIYWIIRNIYQVIQQIAIAKIMPPPKFTEEDYRAAEREFAGKAPKKVKKSERAGTVRSLHHIDDDDDDSAAVQAPAAKENSGSPDSHVGKSPLKDENDRKKATEQEDESEDE